MNVEQLIKGSKKVIPLLIPFLTILALSNFSSAGPADTLAQDSPNSTSQLPTTIELKTYVEKSQVPLNRKVVFHVELSWIGDMKRYQITEIPQPILTNLIMQGSGSSNRLEPLDNGKYRSVKTITYQFKAVEMGMGYIDGISIHYRDSKSGEMDVLHSQRVMVEIVDPIPENTGSGVKALIYIVLLAMFGVAIIYFVIVYFKKKKETQKAPESATSLAEQYLKQLSHHIDPRGTNLQEMTLKLSGIFREYLSKEYQIPAREASNTEICEYLKNTGLEDTELERLQQLFEKLDIVKFAGADIDPSEFSNIYGTVEEFLNQRKKIWEDEKAQMKEA